MKPSRLIRRHRIVGLLIASSMVLAACGSSTITTSVDTTLDPTAAGGAAVSETTTTTAGVAGGGSNELNIVVTTTILGDVVARVADGDARVEVIIPTGADSHEYRPSSRQVATIVEADLVIANGLLLEEGLVDVIEAAEEDGVHVLEIAPLLDPIAFGGLEGGDSCDADAGHDHADDDHADDDHADDDHADDDHADDDHADDDHADDDHADHQDDEAHAHDEGACDPHVWFDPLRMVDAVQVIAAELIELDPSVDWGARAEAYAEELKEAHEDIETMLSAIPDEQRKLVTNHDALGYFAALYEFEIVGVVIPGGSTLGDPSSREIAELVELIEREEIPAIFAETTEPSALAATIASEVGRDVEVATLFVESLGEPGSGADSLIGMLLTNARVIAEALG